jgi:hypothetical protein
MLEKRVKIQSVVENQLPIFLGAELEGASDFLKTYYKSVEYQGGPVDILENIDQYRRVGTYTSIVGFTTVTSNIEIEDTTINVGNTAGWPEKYGLLKINDEIISYTGKTNTTFTGCIRGFSGITSYRGNNGPDELIFKETEADEHVSADQVENISSLFLKEFYKKLKTQYLPGLDNAKLNEGLDVSKYLIQGSDFYRSKGTSDAFEILFKALYNEDVNVLKPQDDLFAPSDAQYRKILRLNAEPVDLSAVDTTQLFLTGLITKNIYQENAAGEIIASGSVLKSERFVEDGKTFFQIDLDYSEPKDINVVGSIYGNFRITPQTKVIGNVSVASTFIDVESTIGFPSSGEIQVLFSNTDVGIVSYTSKNITQFLNVDGVINGILDKQEIYQNIRSYGILPDGSEFEFRIKGSLGKFNIKAPDLATPYFVEGDVIKNQSLGYSKINLVTDSLLSNETSRFNIKHARILNQNQLGQNPNIISLYQIETEQEHELSIGDSIQVITNAGTETSGVVNNIITEFTFDVSGLSGFDPDKGGEIRRLITKVNSQNNVVNHLPANVVKSFYDSNDSVYIASHSLPKYSDPIDPKTGNVILTDNGRSSTAPLILSGDTIDYTGHGFFSGDEVYYRPDKFVELLGGYGEPVAITTVRNLGNLQEGRYFVKRIDADSFKLAESRANIVINNFVDVTGIASNQIIFPITSYENQLDSSYGITKIPSSIEVPDKKINITPGKIGVLINGVDIHSYKSEDYCYYGNLTAINVLAGGSNYDVINPPNLVISDNIGTGATATTTVVGVLEEIEVEDSGYDFLEEPVIDISGGNGRGAKAKANLRSEKTVAFTDVSAGGGNVSLSDNTIGFTTYHRFRNADAVVYNANSLIPLGNLVNNSIYYVNVRSLNEITLHGHRSTALAGVGTVNITSFGQGNQYFTTVNEKKILSSVTIESGGEGYSNNNIRVNSTGINTSADQISFINHGFNTGETVEYKFEGSSISGLTTDQKYLVTRVDDNLFKLSSAGIGTQFSSYNFDNKIFVNFTSVGSASTHIFNYPEISVSINGNIGIATTNSLTFKSSLKPKFRGSISKINLNSGGIGYGSSDVLNFERQPLITFETGSGAQLKPVIEGSTIKEVFVLNEGKGYTSSPQLIVSGLGRNAKLTPILTGGRITSVKINAGGSGFSTNTTFVSVIPNGTGAKAGTSIKSWNVNQFEKKKNLLSVDDSLISDSSNEYSKGTYVSLTVPRALREITYAKNEDGTDAFGANTFDLIKSNGLESPSVNHSPIIGWANDGHPIYGPYGYSNIDGGPIIALKPGFELNPSDDRPNTFPVGFFVEDYTFQNSGNLDECNGRFGKTPDFPNGIYAYFATINSGKSNSDGPFKNYKEPLFPYLLGDSYHSVPTEFNFNRKSNQIDFEYVDLFRNTKPTKTSSFYGFNEYLNDSTRDIRQNSIIESTRKGKITDYNIVSAGSSYKSGDTINLSKQPLFGRSARISVGRIVGKDIVSIGSSTISAENFELFVGGGLAIGYCTAPHNFENKNRAIISGLSTHSYANLNGTQNITNTQRIWILNEYLDSPSNTGLTTNIHLNGPYDPLYVRENSIIGIGLSAENIEQLKVLNVDPLNSVMRVQRNYNGTVGYAYSSGTIALDIRNKFAFDVGFTTFTSNPPTFQRYFDPSQVVGLGTTASVGVGTTIAYQTHNNIAPPHLQENTDYQPGTAYTSRIIPIKTIFIPNHSFNTGDTLTYSNGGGTSIEVSDGIGTFVLSDQSTVYAIKESSNLLGISTTKVGLGSTGSFVGLGSTAIQLAFTVSGVGVTHSFKAETNPITGNANIYEAVLTTKEAHGLTFNDNIRLVSIPNITKNIFVQYNDYNRRIVFDRKKFEPAGITSFTNTINVPNHNLNSGDKVIYTTTGNAPVGLSDQGMYYAIAIDSNNLKLAQNKVDAVGPNPTPVSLGSTGSGEHFVSSINPKVNATRGNLVSFATTDSSLSLSVSGTNLPAFDLNLYTDSEYKDRFISTKETKVFEVQGIGTIGVTNPSAVNLRVSASIPEILYYKFNPINTDLSPTAKTEILIDTEQNFANVINVVNSVYQVDEYPTGITTTEFKFNLNSKPEVSSYNSTTDGSFYYTHKSSNATGAIDSLNIKTNNSNYTELPGIVSIGSTTGSGGLIRINGDMGSIVKTRKRNIGFNYPSDPTLKVIANVPEILRIEELNSFDSVGISSGGNGYNIEPGLVVIDAITNKKIENVILQAEVKNGSISKVNIKENAKNLSDVAPNIITVNNPNGVGINTVGYNTVTREVTIQLNTGFSTDKSFPFSVGGKVFIEGIGISSEGTGYNSPDYNFKFFEVTSIDENIGGIGSVTYQLDSTVTNPGTYVTTKSSGRIIPFEDFPIFAPDLKKNNFSINEDVVITNTLDSKNGKVSSWDNSNKILKVNSSKEILVDDIVKGLGSGTIGKVSEKIDVDSFYDITSVEEIRLGWQKNTGKPSLNDQRIIDSDYYQYFSYSLKSKIAYDTWNDIVSSMNHTGGFKKFADLQIESQDDNFNKASVSSNELELFVDLFSQLETYCRYDFDFVSETSKFISGEFLSDEVLTRNIPIADFEESVGNRVLSIDSFADQFNNTPRATRFDVIDTFPLAGTRYRKYFAMTEDTQFLDERRMQIIELLIDDGGNAYIQEYAIVNGLEDLNGYFDFRALGSEGQLLFYPEKYDTNDYDIHGLVYNVDRDIHSAVGISTIVGITTVGDIIQLAARGSKINPGVTTAVDIYSIDLTSMDAGHKFMFQMSAGEKHEVLNLNALHNNSESYFVEFGNMSNLDRSSTTATVDGIGTFSARVDSNIFYINCTPSSDVVGTGITFNIFGQCFVGGASTIGIATIQLTTGDLRAQYTDVPSASSPGITTIANFGNNTTVDEDGAHVLFHIHDVTNDKFELLEGIFMVDSNGETFETLFGNIETDSDNYHQGIGTISSNVDGSKYNVTYVAPPLTNVRVKTLVTSAAHTKGGVEEILYLDLQDTKIDTFDGTYTNTQADVRRAFGLFHGGDAIFERSFDSTDPLIVDTDNDLIIIPNHFFTSGERLSYNPIGSGTTSSIGIGTTTISGYGSTDKLPEYFYAIKVDDKSIRIAGSSEDALASNVGNYLTLTTVGIGTSHTFTSQDQNTKCIIALDNNIQDPVIPLNITHNLVEDMSFGGELMRLSGITSFFGGDLLKVDKEFMTVKQVGFGSTNLLVVQRSWMGSGLSTHSTGSVVEKYEGSYNIVDNTINFYTAPTGTKPQEDPTDPNQLDWTGIQTSSVFQGRTFLRNGLVGTSTHTYATNYLFDSISTELTGVGKTFTLKQDGINIGGFSTTHGLVLINDIAQIPSQGSRINDFEFTENAGITSVVFSGFAASVTNDVNTGSIPVGGVIVSVGSTQGFGYQPLVAAGGTANISGFGTVTSISIGNSGSGYRSGISTLDGVVRELSYSVGLRTSDIDTVEVTAIGTAIVSNGNITSVNITNPGVGYTFSNPPIVVFDNPIPYTRVPLIYHPDSTGSNIGTNAYVDIQVSQNSKVANFNIINSGYGFKVGEILTVPKGGVTGIPTNSTVGAGFIDFKINVNRVNSDKFTGWRFGDLDVFDKLDSFFDGSTKVFVMRKEGVPTSIRAKKGSLIDVEQTIIVFLNNTLQEPGVAYEFNGGSNIIFSEAPKVGDTCSILFYRGTGSVDVISRDIIETIKTGDTIRINAGDNQNSFVFDQDTRFVSGITTADTFATSPYQGPGLTTDRTIQRPMVWCKQQEDVFLNGKPVTKNRDLYTARIFPETHIIKPVGIGSTEIWVDGIGAFDSYPESLRSNLQTVQVMDQDIKVGASATAIISGFGTVSSISVTNTGLGYTATPLVSIANSVGFGSATRATAIASITGTAVTSINVSNAGAGYTFSNPPVILLTPPNFEVEEIKNVNYAGDYGVISGVSSASATKLVFDLLIPLDSNLRSTAFMGPGAARTISNIASGYPFVVFDSNIGQGVTSLDLGGSVLGIGTTCLDNVYEAASVSVATTEAVGIGTTYVVKVTVNIDSHNGITGIGYSQFFGRYSWGQLKTFNRSGIAKTFTPALNNGFTGISTGPLVLRSQPLKSVGYLT